MRPLSQTGNLWLADTLWKLGAIQFGDFTLGRTAVHSPVHVNLRLLISKPAALQRAARVIRDEGGDAAAHAEPAGRAVPARRGSAVRRAAPGDGLLADGEGAADLHPAGASSTARASKGCTNRGRRC